METERIDKQHQSGTFDIVERGSIDSEAEVSGENAYEKHESYTERDATHLNFAERKSDCANNCHYNNRLQRAMLDKHLIDKVHNLLL